jgi:ketosteroid isomerase-like protein
VKAAPAVPLDAAAQDVLQVFIAALSAGDVRAATACFTREACLVTPDGTAIHGRSEIAGILDQLRARRTEISVEQLVVREAGDVALADGRLTIRSDGPEGARIAQSCDPAAALHRVEGTWKIAVLDPWAANFTARL